MKVVSLALLLLVAVPSFAEEAAPAFMSGMVKPPVTYQEVADKLKAVNDALAGVEIKAKDAELVSSIQKAIAWSEAKVRQDLKVQASDLIAAKDACEGKVRELEAK